MITQHRNIKLLTVSEYAAEILAHDKIKIQDTNCPSFMDLLEQIWDLYPGLYHEENYDIYWRYSKTLFLKISDFNTYFNALTLMSENTFYLILRDSEEWNSGQKPQFSTCRDIEILLEALEKQPCPKYFTETYKQMFKVVEDVKKDYPARLAKSQLHIKSHDHCHLTHRSKSKSTCPTQKIRFAEYW